MSDGDISTKDEAMSLAGVEPKTYRIRRSCGKWYLRVFEGYTFDKHVEDIGPFEYHEAVSFAKEFDMADGDKGPEQAHVRGYHNVR